MTTEEPHSYPVCISGSNNSQPTWTRKQWDDHKSKSDHKAQNKRKREKWQWEDDHSASHAKGKGDHRQGKGKGKDGKGKGKSKGKDGKGKGKDGKGKGKYDSKTKLVIGASAHKVRTTETETHVQFGSSNVSKAALAKIVGCGPNDRCWPSAMSSMDWPWCLLMCHKAGKKDHEDEHSKQHIFTRAQRAKCRKLSEK